MYICTFTDKSYGLNFENEEVIKATMENRMIEAKGMQVRDIP